MAAGGEMRSRDPASPPITMNKKEYAELCKKLKDIAADLKRVEEQIKQLLKKSN